MESKTDRVKPIELMKAVAIVGMVYVHALESTIITIIDNVGIDAFFQTAEAIPCFIIEILGGIFSAGVFMFAMGWGAAYNKGTPAMYIKNAGRLYVWGLFINLFTEYYIRLAEPQYFGADSLKSCLYVLFSVDIYFFAALCMLVFALMKKLPDVKSRAILSAAIMTVSVIVNLFVPNGALATGNGWIDTMFTGLFLRQNEQSYFPFVNWAVFPIMGYWSAYFYINTENKKKYFTFTAAAAAVLLGIGQAVIITKGLDQAALIPALVTEDEYYGMNVWNISCGCGLVLGEMLLFFGITKLTHNKLPGFVLRMSKNVMLIYIFQWILHCLLFTVYLRLTSVWVNVLIATGVLIASYWLAVLTEKIKNKKKNSAQAQE